jgi:2-polyprenyl-6-hydroxyphenyl methylase/3-demethylubiquinone-9 3-methyltransferase
MVGDRAVPGLDGSVSAAEIGRFAAHAEEWWNPDASFRALHRFNPARLGFIRTALAEHFARDGAALEPFTGLSLLDIGCGGGLVAEAMARLGCAVTGIDAGAEAIAAARAHGEAAGLAIDYRTTTAEAIAAESRCFDVVSALEVIEHLGDAAPFYRAVGELVKPGGAFVAGTLNRTARSFALAIVGAEYILNWLPPGSHDWRHFVRPSELARRLRQNGLRLASLAGVRFDPLTGGWSLSADLAVNYLAFAVRDQPSV